MTEEFICALEALNTELILVTPQKAVLTPDI